MVIDAEVRHYRSGACFAMAEALHRLTGFPIRYIDFGGLAHAFVLSPEGDVLDIHGRMTWPAFLTFLVTTGQVPAEVVHRVEHHAYAAAELENSIYWRHRGFKPPSRSAIQKAVTVAQRHPNLANDRAIVRQGT